MTKFSKKVLATIISIGVGTTIIRSNHQLPSFLYFGNNNDDPRALKINTNYPYAPYKGEIEPPPSRRQLAAYEYFSNGTLHCWAERILSAEEIPNEDFVNTIVVGYPGADKRIVLRQMELMTMLSGRDAWDFEFLGMTRQPFIKTNYPHHEGIWGES